MTDLCNVEPFVSLLLEEAIHEVAARAAIRRGGKALVCHRRLVARDGAVELHAPRRACAHEEREKEVGRVRGRQGEDEHKSEGENELEGT